MRIVSIGAKLRKSKILSEQIQCCLKYPEYDLLIDTVRLMSLSEEGWEALARVVGPLAQPRPVLKAVLHTPLPVFVPRQTVFELHRECSEPLALNGLARDTFEIMAAFVAQVVQQREAGASFEIWPGESFDEQIQLERGVDVLSDLAELEFEDDEE